jgi:hypothetical protein
MEHFSPQSHFTLISCLNRLEKSIHHFCLVCFPTIVTMLTPRRRKSYRLKSRTFFDILIKNKKISKISNQLQLKTLDQTLNQMINEWKNKYYEVTNMCLYFPITLTPRINSLDHTMHWITSKNKMRMITIRHNETMTLFIFVPFVIANKICSWIFTEIDRRLFVNIGQCWVAMRSWRTHWFVSLHFPMMP